MPKKAMESLTESMFYVLMALTRRPMCGIEAVRFVSDKTAGRISIGPATLYTVLAKFESEGYIEEAEVRKFGFQNTKAWFKRAVGNFDAKLQEAFPAEYSLHIDTWEGVSNGNDQSEQIESIKNHFENNKFQNMFVNTPNIVAAILFVASAGLAFVTLYSLIVTVLAAGFLGFRVFKAIQGYPVRIQAAVDNLNAEMNEIAEFRRYYEEQRAKKGELLSTVV